MVLAKALTAAAKDCTLALVDLAGGREILGLAHRYIRRGEIVAVDFLEEPMVELDPFQTVTAACAPATAVEKRLAAMVQAMRGDRSIGPNALRAAVEMDLGVKVTRAQITDLLRRRPHLFRKIKRGEYTLRGASS